MQYEFFNINTIPALVNQNFFLSMHKRGVSSDGIFIKHPTGTGGRGLNLVSANLGAYFEFLERKEISLLQYDKIKKHLASELNLSSDQIECWSPFMKEQKINDNYLDFNTAYTNLPLVQSYDLLQNKHSYLPLELVSFSQDKMRFFPKIDTTGMAAHLYLDQAVLNAILELIEKNAIIYFWLLKKAENKLIHNKQTKILYKLLQMADRLELKPEFFILHSIVPDINVVFCVARTRLSFPFFSLGLAADLDTYIASEKALAECIQLHLAYQYELETFGGISGFSDEGYCKSYMQRNTEKGFYDYLNCLFELDEKKINPTDTIKNPLTQCLKLFKKQINSLHLYIYPRNSHTQEIIVKVMSPELFWSLIPISLDLPMNRSKFLNHIQSNKVPKITETVLFP